MLMTIGLCNVSGVTISTEISPTENKFHAAKNFNQRLSHQMEQVKGKPPKK